MLENRGHASFRAGQAVERRLAAAREESVAEFLAALPEHDVHALAGLVDPVLAGTPCESIDTMRRLCRLCDRTVCDPCPAEAAEDGG